MPLSLPWLACFVIVLNALSMDRGRAPQGVLREGPLVFVYNPEQERAAAALAEGVRRSAPLPGLPANVLSGGEIRIYLASDPTAFDSLAPGAPDWSGGIAYPEGDRIVLPTFAPRAGGTPLAAVLRHELAHIALRRYLGTRVPRWFHEGYAELATGGWGSQEAWALRLAILVGRVPRLDSVNLDFRRERLGARDAYLLAYTAVELLHRIGGRSGFTRLLERWRELGALDPAIRRTYGLTLGQYERVWREEVRDRFGWLLLVSQAVVSWTLLTVLLLVLGYWKRKRDRRKLAALRSVESVATYEGRPGGEIDENMEET